MPGCAVAMCKNTNRNTRGSGIKYFSFPQNEDLAKQWIRACGREDKINLKHARVCSVHFETNSFEIPMRQRLLQYNPINSRNLKSDAIPELHLCSSLPKVKTLESSHRMNKTTQHKTVTETLRDSTPDFERATCDENLLHESHVEPMTGTYVKTSEETKQHGMNELGELRKKIERLQKKNAELLQQVHKYENALAEVSSPRQLTVHPPQQHVSTVPIEVIVSDNELTCGTQPISSNQQLIGCVAIHVKHELANDERYTKMKEHSATLNSVMQSSFDEDKERSAVSTDILPSVKTSVKNEEDPHGSAPWSISSDHMLCKCEPVADKKEAYDQSTECCDHAELEIYPGNMIA